MQNVVLGDEMERHAGDKESFRSMACNQIFRRKSQNKKVAMRGRDKA